MTLKISFNHLLETVTCKATLITAYSRLLDRKVVSVHRLPTAVRGLTFTPVCVNKEKCVVRLVSNSYDHLLQAIDCNSIIKL
jgi:hypothetical protein